MNRKTLLLSFGAIVMLGSACAVLWVQTRSIKQREVAALEAARAEADVRAQQEVRLQEAEKERARVEKQNTQLAELAQNLRRDSDARTSNLTARIERLAKSGGGAGGGSAGTGSEPGGGPGGFGEMMSKMMEDPAMQEMIRTQQKSVMKKMYGALFKELNLSPDDQKKLTDLMLDSQMGAANHMSALMGQDKAAKEQAAAAMADGQKKANEDIKSLLGEEKFGQYERYQKTIADRMVLDQFQERLGDTPLADAQREKLLQAMIEERQRVPPIFSDAPEKTAETMSMLSNAEQMEKHLKWQEELNERVTVRAGQWLNPEQLEEFTKFQASQVNMQRMGLKMMKEMSGGGKGSPPPPAAK